MTIDNAIKVVQALGMRYLWADAVCNDQADIAQKMSQVKIMNLIYAGAFATIIALQGDSANSGLPRASTHYAGIKQRRVKCGPSEVVSILPRLADQLTHSPWAKRGWTFQEGIFSSHCLIFTEHQVYFHCHKMQGRSPNHPTIPNAHG